MIRYERKGGDTMEYNFELFNAVTDALEALEAARNILVKAQQNAEDIYISAKD
jgi:hypothetical protein